MKGRIGLLVPPPDVGIHPGERVACFCEGVSCNGETGALPYRCPHLCEAFRHQLAVDERGTCNDVPDVSFAAVHFQRWPVGLCDLVVIWPTCVNVAIRWIARRLV